MAETELCRVLLVDDEPDMLNLLAKVLTKNSACTVSKATSADLAMRMIAESPPLVVLTDIKMSGMDGLELLRQVSSFDPTITTILMTGYGTIEMAVQALKDGAYDFIEKPFDNNRIIGTVTRALERTRLLRENVRLQHRLTEDGRQYGFVGRSRRLRQTLEILARIARSSSTVLIRGESGTGKELAAKALHAMSDRAGRAMVTVNCPALPEHILESELFGYQRGAFTGADRDKRGLFIEAEGSTILLDEIADIPVAVQTKLLRVLQEKEVQPLGQTRTSKVDVRVVASTNQDLEEKIRRGEFREDPLRPPTSCRWSCRTLRKWSKIFPCWPAAFLVVYIEEHDRGSLEFQPESLQYRTASVEGERAGTAELRQSGRAPCRRRKASATRPTLPRGRARSSPVGLMWPTGRVPIFTVFRTKMPKLSASPVHRRLPCRGSEGCRGQCEPGRPHLRHGEAGVPAAPAAVLH